MQIFIAVFLIGQLFAHNILCHIRTPTNVKQNEDDLPTNKKSHESQLNVRLTQTVPKNHELAELKHRQPRLYSQPPNANQPSLPPVNAGFQARLGPFVQQSQPTRPHPIFHEPPPRFRQNFAPERNQVDMDLPEGDMIHHTSIAGTKDMNEQWPLPMPEMPKVIHLDVKCEKNLMKVNIEFDKPFNGLIFSKGHHSYRNCIYLPPNTGRKSVFFDISINNCGTMGNAKGTLYNEDSSSDNGLFFENIVVIQYDPQVQEAWDQARKLRCTWHEQYEKAVSFRPFPVDMLDVVRADFAGDNVGCWMQIQVGKGPWASEVAGIVKIGQTMTMVLAIKDEENKFDMLVRNCIAHDGKRPPIELVDGNGCIMRPKLMTRFTKIKNFGSSASVLSYTHFQAFKFPDSMEVHFQCTIQICRFQCPEQCSQQSTSELYSLYNNGDQHDDGDIRKKREVMLTNKQKKVDINEVGLNKAIQVVSPRDLSFPVETPLDQLAPVSASVASQPNITTHSSICIPTYGFIFCLLLLSLASVFCTIVTMVLLRKPNKQMLEKGKHLHTSTGSSKLPNLYEMIRMHY